MKAHGEHLAIDNVITDDVQNYDVHHVLELSKQVTFIKRSFQQTWIATHLPTA